MAQKGQISVQTENIFPIIKKFLYSDQEIFLRELVANATDATTKAATLARRGEIAEDLGDLSIEIILDTEAKTLTIRDKGIGMTEEEVMKYLNQVAFSSATEFLEKYKNESQGNIIGHFGLGFYSAFMVAQKVEVVTRSYKGSEAVKWTCLGDTNYTIEPSERPMRGTDVILHLAEEESEFAEKNRIEELLNKYCKFLPYPIQFGFRTETIELEAQEPSEAGEEENEAKTETREVANIINEVAPLWKKSPSQLKDEDYTKFYQTLFPYSPAPLFWVHLNIDYPFNLTGVLYFPKLGNQIEIQRNKIQLYSNQMFVTDEVKDIVPEFLTLLHGVIDSPDIPLNVSRSYLQSDRNVKKISEYISKKVADKLEDLFRDDRKAFEEKWENINVFIKYGYVSEERFAERADKFSLVQNTKGEYFTLDEYVNKVKDQQTDKNQRLVFLYTNQPEAHFAQIKAAEDRGYDVLKMESLIDLHFLNALERKHSEWSFARVDADTLENLIKKDENRESVLSKEEQDAVLEIFKKDLDLGSKSVQVQALSPEDLPVSITRPEFMRRMKEMSAFQNNGMDMPEYYNIVVNGNHPSIVELAKQPDASKAQYLYDLARLQQGLLSGGELADFIQNSLKRL